MILKKFTTDGCSVMTQVWDFVSFGKLGNLPWHQACVEHDVEYWVGGNAADRQLADEALRNKVGKVGWPITGWLMYFAVRLGGHPRWKFPWRWGYGFEYPYYYQIRTSQVTKRYLEELDKQCK